MGWQSIETEPRNECAVIPVDQAVIPVDQDADNATALRGTAQQEDLSQRQSTSTAVSSVRCLAGSTAAEGRWKSGRPLARASATAGACILWLAMAASGDKALCGEDGSRRQTAGSAKVDVFAGQSIPTQRSDIAQNKAVQAPQPALAAERKQPAENENEKDRAEALRCAPDSSLREELEAVRSAAEAAAIEQGQALDQERDRADALSRELNTARIDSYLEGVQALDAELKQRQALEREQARADGLARDLTAIQAELGAARTEGPKAQQAATAEVEQKHALEQKLKQERERAEGLAGELTSLRAELETLRAEGSESVRIAQAAKIEQGLELGKSRSNNETLARELASARKEAEERSARLAAAHAHALQVAETNRAIAAEQKQALAGERDRADAVTRELTSFKREVEARNQQISVLNALSAMHPREPAGHNSDERMAASSPRTIEASGRSLEQVPGEVVVATGGQSSASEPQRSQAQSPVGGAASALDPKPSMVAEQVTSGSATSRSPLDEQRLLVRANALLRRADISGARPLLEHALERGSARAAFMLAETYDARVLEAWRVRGISGDSTKARAFYQLAQAGGIEDAKKRIETLK